MILRTYLILSLVFLPLVAYPLGAHAAECTKTGSACIDNALCKTISGEKVCLSQFGLSCWEYEDTYSCRAQNAVDYCAAINSTPGCSQTSSVCATPSSSGCTRWTNTYRCGGSPAAPANTVQLNTTYTITKDTTNTSACDSLSSNPTCQLASHMCAEVAGTRNINGLDVYKDCWKWEDSYSCRGEIQSDCADLETKGCTFSSSTCISPEGATGTACELSEKIYTCPSGEPTAVLDCGSQQYCTDGNCFNTSHTPDSDLASAVVAQEIGRHGAIYADGQQRLFGGASDSCKKSALANCCKAKGGAVNNSSIGGKILTTVGLQAIYAGSAYMYDLISGTYHAMTGIGSMAAAAAGTATTTEFSMGAYGVTMTATPGAGVTFAFDPTTLAISIAIMVIMDLTSCEQSEKILGQKIGAGLCRHYQTSCNGRFCYSTTSSYCCFNSKLAKIVNTAAVTQLGRANSDCSGLTMDEFGQLDFSAIDISEFVAEITSTVTLPSTGPINADANSSVQQKMLNYYERGRQ